MTVTYEQAREIVRQAVEPGWSYGTFCIDDRTIVENDIMFAFNVVAREFVVDRDERFGPLDGGLLPVVYKKDGQIGWLSNVDIATDDSLRDRPNPSPTLRI